MNIKDEIIKICSQIKDLILLGEFEFIEYIPFGLSVIKVQDYYISIFHDEDNELAYPTHLDFGRIKTPLHEFTKAEQKLLWHNIELYVATKPLEAKEQELIDLRSKRLDLKQEIRQMNQAKKIN